MNDRPALSLLSSVPLAPREPSARARAMVFRFSAAGLVLAVRGEALAPSSGAGRRRERETEEIRRRRHEVQSLSDVKTP